MAMLAEKKRKVKWCLNPRGNDWAKDENKFGQKLLEKMGWEPGMGLGAKGQGRTEILRVQIKTDTRGFGNKEKLDEVWTEQQQNFDQLLANLNGGSDSTDGSIKVSSLEDKSKNSRARVHYHKFTRGKDVSRYSSKDLNSIIGISTKPSENSSEESKEKCNSMYDYFNMKSQMLKRSFVQNEDRKEKIESFDVSSELELNSSFEESEDVQVDNKSKKKKKKRRISQDEEIVDGTIGNDQEQTDIPIKKKKKKKRKENYDSNCGVVGNKDNEISEDIIINNEEIEPLVKNINEEPLKKKKKKRHKNTENSLNGD